MTKIILASASPRRREILTSMGLKFEIIPSDYDEILENLQFSYEKIEDLAYNKAKAVLKNITTPAIIISADTVVVLENEIIGKPQDEIEAINMLQKLSGKKHFVVTSVCAINSITSKKRILSETSYVEFNNLTIQLIENYIKNFNPLDKAGSYGIQELPEGFVKSIEGSFENIIGLCPLIVEKLLNMTVG